MVAPLVSLAAAPLLPARMLLAPCLLCAVLLLPTVGSCQTAIITQRYDNARTGQNLSETILNTANVNSTSFGKLFTRAVDDQVYAQPLYVPKVTIPGLGVRNILYVATANNSVYAFDADEPSAATPLWHINLTDAVPGARPVRARDVGQGCGTYRNQTGNIGIVGTPVIDPATRTLYVVARSKTDSLAIGATTWALYESAG